MPPNLLRLAYMSEFLVALVSILELWSQVGGQGHLDMMPWYVKLGFVLGLAFVTVAGTSAVVSHERIWNAKTIACLLLAVALAGGMGMVTYYYHVHENDDVDSDEDTGVAFVLPSAPACRLPGGIA
jgi:Ni/Fe-hydrogenase subunit HybB-like protein